MQTIILKDPSKTYPARVLEIDEAPPGVITVWKSQPGDGEKIPPFD